MHNFSKKHHHHQPQQKHSFNFVKLPSFHGSNDPSLYLDWEAKVEHIFHVYKVTEDDRDQVEGDFTFGGRGHPPKHLKFFLLVF